MNPNLYSIVPEDLNVNQHFFIREESQEFTELELLEPIINKQQTYELSCLSITTRSKRLLIINKSFPIDIFVSKLNTEWRLT